MTTTFNQPERGTPGGNQSVDLSMKEIGRIAIENGDRNGQERLHTVELIELFPFCHQMQCHIRDLFRSFSCRFHANMPNANFRATDLRTFIHQTLERGATLLQNCRNPYNVAGTASGIPANSIGLRSMRHT